MKRTEKQAPRYAYDTIAQRLRSEWKVYLGALALVAVADLIGKKEISLGVGALIIFPIVYALVFGVALGPEALKFFSAKEVKAASGLVLVGIGPFIAKLGITAGKDIMTVFSAGPALFLRELGNLTPIFLVLPIAIFLGMKRAAIGACHSLNREVNLALISDVYGADSAESRGSLSVYIVGGLIGTIYFGLMASVCASTGLWHPYALAMASGVGAAIMMAAASASLASIYPAQSEQILAFAGASAALTSILGIYVGLFIALPLSNKLYAFLEPRIGRITKAGRRAAEELEQERAAAKEE